MSAEATLAPAIEPAARPLGERFGAWWETYWYAPVDITRLRYFTRIIFAAILYTIWQVDYWVPLHGWAPRELWQPIAIARWFNIPAPTETTVTILHWVLTVALVAGIALARPSNASWNRIAARSANAVVFVAFGLWNIWSFSWSKVDHDRLVITVALGVLCVFPAVGTGTNRLVTWALRTIQVVFVMTYPLSAIAKIQKSGWFWPSSAVFARAIIRRGSGFGEWVMQYPAFLRFGQWSFLTFEFVSIVALSTNRWVRRVFVPGFFFLHLFTWMAIGIHFLPNTICLAAFLPLEKLQRLWPTRKVSADV